MKANINGVTVEIDDSKMQFPEVPPEPSLEERLEAVEAALLEQLLRGINNV